MKTTMEIEIGDLFEETVDCILSEIEEATENIRKCRPHGMLHTVDVDIGELLAEGHAIGLIWDTGMVRSTYPHLGEEQAWEILRHCESDYTAEAGLTWDDIGQAVAELHPDPDDFLVPERIARGEKALGGYTDPDETANLTDLLSDLLHWCKRKGLSFEQALTTATTHFFDETDKGRRP